MKNYKKILIFFIILLVFVSFTITVYAADNTVTINTGPADKFIFELDEEMTWKEYIQNFDPEGFTYTNDGVYYQERRIVMIKYEGYQANGNTLPDDYITTEISYDLAGGCNHEYSIIFNSYKSPCKDSTRIYKCRLCGYQYTEEFEASAEHQFGVELSTYISPTCSSPGYVRYVCSACGAYDSSKEIAIDPLAHVFLGGSCIAPAVCRECGIKGDESQYRHNWQEATCTEPEYCLDCKKLGDDSALGHDINWAGSCDRDGCHHNEYFNNIKSSAVIVWDNVSASASNAFESVKSFFVGDENSEGLLDGAKNVFKVGIMIISVIVLIVIIYAVVRLAILIINVIKGLKISNARNKRRKKRKKRKEKVRSE